MIDVKAMTLRSRVNSHRVAELFKEPHENVLRAVDRLLKRAAGSNLIDSLFVERRLSDERGNVHRSFDMTWRGFALLAMTWWPPEVPVKVRVAVIEAFDALEANVKRKNPVAAEKIVAPLNEMFAALPVRWMKQSS